MQWPTIPGSAAQQTGRQRRIGAKGCPAPKPQFRLVPAIVTAGIDVASIENAGTLTFEDAGSSTVSGNFSNTGSLDIDTGMSAGGGTDLTIGRTFTNDGDVQIGSAYTGLAFDDVVTVTSLVNKASGELTLYGSYAPGGRATIDVRES